ncbi:hypothetical protein [Nocardia beijingensis]
MFAVFSGGVAGHGVGCGDRASVFDVAVFDALAVFGAFGVEPLAQMPVLLTEGVVLVAQEVAFAFGAGLGDTRRV